jgi:hypothetical protein
MLIHFIEKDSSTVYLFESFVLVQKVKDNKRKKRKKRKRPLEGIISKKLSSPFDFLDINLTKILFF